MPKRYRFNNQIRVSKVRVIDETGKNLGIFDTPKAIQMAQERNLDLVEIVPKLSPPVCKIMDYGKFLYRKEKEEKSQKIKQKGGELKGIRIGINTSFHDLEIKGRLAEKFLKERNKVKVEMILKGREKTLEDFARQKFTEFLEIIKQKIEFKVEQEIKRGPTGLTMIISKI